eukprot:XP_025980116.1 uncharacterized protein K02A2.6-like [Glycine max]
MSDSSHTPGSAVTLETAILKLTQHQMSLSESVDNMTQKFDELLLRLPLSPIQPQPTSAPTLTPPVPATQHRMKLDIPRFDGTDPCGWVFKINQYFQYHATPEHERLTIVAFYMEGRALAWFQWMTSNGQLTSWPSFLHALQTRFAATTYEDPTGSLFKLTQTGTVAQYLSDFEDLANRIVGLPAQFLLSCFISGLTPEIRREVQALQPMTLVQAAGLARLQEDKLLDTRSSFRHRAPPTLTIPVSRPAPTTALLPSPPSRMPTPRSPTLRPQPTLKRLSPEEIISHRCASRVFFLVAKEDPAAEVNIEELDPGPDPPATHDPLAAQISFNSLAGQLAPETLRLLGTLSGHQVIILVDGGSTHNFVQEELVVRLGLKTHETRPLRVMVGNDQHLACNQWCEAVAVAIQGISFTIDMYVLPIVGANLVLGVQWLKSLGPVLTNYNSMLMKFFHEGQLVELHGDTELSLNLLSPPQFRRLLRKSHTGVYFHITVLEDEPQTGKSPHPRIQSLIDRFPALFQPPSSLPPAREIDHHIHLLPQAAPVNVRPYRYPHYQKHEIESQVESMLQKGLIRPSNSPFSSPVLLVRKQDGSWRFCMDYRALNAITVRDRFPIPTIDELLDELGKACWFSKLDLLQGYHQIRMNSDDIAKTAFRTHHGHYEFKVMPFGLCNAPSSFQATMNMIFRPFLRRFVIVFFDDILIYSVTFDDHLVHLEQAFQVLAENQFVLKLTKCSFGQPQVEYLGHMVSSKGVEPVASKVSAIHHWPVPQSTRALRSFLGLAGFYRRFIRGYASIAAPLV